MAVLNDLTREDMDGTMGIAGHGIVRSLGRDNILGRVISHSNQILKVNEKDVNLQKTQTRLGVLWDAAAKGNFSLTVDQASLSQKLIQELEKNGWYLHFWGTVDPVFNFHLTDGIARELNLLGFCSAARANTAVTNINFIVTSVATTTRPLWEALALLTIWIP